MMQHVHILTTTSYKRELKKNKSFTKNRNIGINLAKDVQTFR